MVLGTRSSRRRQEQDEQQPQVVVVTEPPSAEVPAPSEEQVTVVEVMEAMVGLDNTAPLLQDEDQVRRRPRRSSFLSFLLTSGHIHRHGKQG